MIFDEEEIFNQIMSGVSPSAFNGALIEPPLDLEAAALILNDVPGFIQYNKLAESRLSVEDFDHRNQQTWFMPDEYKQLDIAKHLLDLCKNDVELQRVGEELLLYVERDLLDLLRYLKYLVDVMTDNKLIWGVGRGSSVSSYVLYLLGIHKINSIYYDLDPREFLR